MVVNALDRRMLDPSGQVVEFLPEPDVSHDVETEKH